MTEHQPADCVVEDAIRASTLSPCRSKRGAVTFLGETVLTSGWNHQVEPFTCDESAECKARCRETAIHAEQDALTLVSTNLRGCDLLHVKTVDGQLVPSGPPSCVQCSKLAVAFWIAGVWLYHEHGWTRYQAAEFHRLSVATAAAADTWRNWAQFVYLGGGAPTLSDDELRAAVCKAHDDEITTLKLALSSSLNAIDLAAEQLGAAETARIRLQRTLEHAERDRDAAQLRLAKLGHVI